MYVPDECNPTAEKVTESGAAPEEGFAVIEALSPPETVIVAVPSTVLLQLGFETTHVPIPMIVRYRVAVYVPFELYVWLPTRPLGQPAVPIAGLTAHPFIAFAVEPSPKSSRYTPAGMAPGFVFGKAYQKLTLSGALPDVGNALSPVAPLPETVTVTVPSGMVAIIQRGLDHMHEIYACSVAV